MTTIRETIEAVLKDAHIETGRKDEWERVVGKLATAIAECVRQENEDIHYANGSELRAVARMMAEEFMNAPIRAGDMRATFGEAVAQSSDPAGCITTSWRPSYPGEREPPPGDPRRYGAITDTPARPSFAEALQHECGQWSTPDYVLTPATMYQAIQRARRASEGT